MSTSLWQLLGTYKIVVPSLQRDYAQGRDTDKVRLIRKEFLKALHAACAVTDKSGAPLELDFIYGYTRSQSDGPGHFIPLDGQQRLTTLFLLHWFIAVKEQRMKEAGELLARFTYETRHSSRMFCEELVKFVPDDPHQPVKDAIRNQPWFFTSWENDPTITAMLTMLEAIEQQFAGMDNVWPRLTGAEPRIAFHLLPMEKLRLPDDLYIKMNSRGKELTEFEYFKSSFAQLLPSGQSEIFNTHIDRQWSDLFWNLLKDSTQPDIARQVDNAFLRFFRYITDIQAVLHNVEPLKTEYDYFEQVYNGEARVNFLFDCLNLFHNCYHNNTGFFTHTFYTEAGRFEEGKTRLFFSQAKADLFRKCAESYDASQRTNSFSIGEQLMLYACIVHLQHQSPAFPDRIRKVRNLISNSDDTVRKEYMASLLAAVRCIIVNDQIPDNARFNTAQVNEEAAKQDFVAAYPVLKPLIHQLEDHHLLQGCITLFKLDDDLPAYAGAFQQLFTQGCDYYAIHRALLTVDDYSQEYYPKTWRFGNQHNFVWRELFTASKRDTYPQTRKALYAFMDKLIQAPGLFLDGITQGYLASFDQEPSKPRGWRYYFIRYEGFRKQNDEGFFYWENYDDHPYDCIKLRRTTWGGFHWSPFLYTLRDEFGGALHLDNYNSPLILTRGNATLHILHINTGFKLDARNEEGEALLKRAQATGLINGNELVIKQDATGLDVEDRIEKAKTMIPMLMKV